MKPMSKNYSPQKLYKRLRERFAHEREEVIREYVEGCNSLIGRLNKSVYHSHIALDLESEKKCKYYGLSELRVKVNDLRDVAFFDKLGKLTGFD